jgi:hypothetical protein
MSAMGNTHRENGGRQHVSPSRFKTHRYGKAAFYFFKVISQIIHNHLFIEK